MRSDSQAVQRFFFVPSIFPRLLLLAFSFSMYHSSIYTRYYHVPGMFCFRFFFLCSRIHFSAILMVWLECSPHWAGHRFPLEYISYNRHFRPKYVPDPYAVRAGPAAKSLPERQIGHSPPNFTYLGLMFGYDVHGSNPPTHKLKAGVFNFLFLSRYYRNNDPKKCKSDRNLS